MTEYYPGPQEITQVEETQLIVQPIVRVLEYTAPGPQGPQGPPGASGGSRYIHAQITPSAVWPITHNLGYKPVFSTVIVNGTDVTDGADIVHTGLNTLTIQFSQAVAGEAAFL